MFRNIKYFIQKKNILRLAKRRLNFDNLLSTITAETRESIAYLKVDRKDCKHSFLLRTLSTDFPTCKQVFIDKEYDFSVREVPKVIVDAGANVGLASIYFANKYPDAKIIAIEPEKSNFDLLEENVAPYHNIIPLQAALWNENGEINLIDPGFGKWGFMTEVKNSSEEFKGDTCHTVMATTIDKLMNDYNLESIDILKIDIEGAEREVFEDTLLWIKKVNSIIIELHERMKTGCNRSFYCGSSGFDNEWKQGENVYLSRKNYLTRRSI